MIELDKADIQGNILHGYKFPSVAHVFGSIDVAQVPSWKQFLHALTDRLTVDTDRFDWSAAGTTLNVGLSHAALAKLHARPAGALSLPFPAFVAGMANRSKALGDRQEPEVPWKLWSARDVWISIHGRDEAEVKQRLADVKNLAQGIKLLDPELWGKAIEVNGFRFEPFGFRDGITSPAIDGAFDGDPKNLAGNGKKGANGSWHPLAAGEFILGYPNERAENVLEDLPTDLQKLLQNGTFAVFRELEQHVSEFQKYVSLKAEQTGEKDIAEKMIGRTRDGDSLTAPGQEANFTYAADEEGARCPVGAHIRRANPRKEGLGLHQLVRRGMPYTIPAGADSPVTRQGLYFVAMNASIENQFEFMQKTWLNGPAGSATLSGARDPVASSGNGVRKMLIEGNGPRLPILLRDIPEFVTCRGGEYYFMPGRRALQVLSAGAAIRSKLERSPGFVQEVSS